MSDEENEEYTDYAKCPKCENVCAEADLSLGTIYCSECGYRTPEGEADC